MFVVPFPSSKTPTLLCTSSDFLSILSSNPIVRFLFKTSFFKRAFQTSRGVGETSDATATTVLLPCGLQHSATKQRSFLKPSGVSLDFPLSSKTAGKPRVYVRFCG
ncbi:hypothetical protein KCU62_g459, partial [Aureobasidium sp. EXF-3399]